jgi:hypothetical protein
VDGQTDGVHPLQVRAQRGAVEGIRCLAHFIMTRCALQNGFTGALTLNPKPRARGAKERWSPG